MRRSVIRITTSASVFLGLLVAALSRALELGLGTALKPGILNEDPASSLYPSMREEAVLLDPELVGLIIPRSLRAWIGACNSTSPFASQTGISQNAISVL